MQNENEKEHVLKYKLAYSGIILLVYIVGKNIPLYKIDLSAYAEAVKTMTVKKTASAAS